MQSFGAKNYSSLGIILQRALLVTAAASILVISFWTQMDRVLILLGNTDGLRIIKAQHFSLPFLHQVKLA